MSQKNSVKNRMIKEVPKFYETFKPILETLKLDDNISRAKLREKVIEKYYSDIPEELLSQRIKSGEILIHNRLNWGISYLKQAGFVIQPKRGFVQLTEKGKKVNCKTSAKSGHDIVKT